LFAQKTICVSPLVVVVVVLFCHPQYLVITAMAMVNTQLKNEGITFIAMKANLVDLEEHLNDSTSCNSTNPYSWIGVNYSGSSTSFVTITLTPTTTMTWS
jgi:hypothetical protein